MRAPCLSLSALLLVASIGLSLSIACATPDHEHVTAPPPLAIRVVPATVIERAEPLEAGGLVAATETAVVSSRVVAPVIAVMVQAGDRVRAGETLVQLDSRDWTARVREAGATARAAEEALTAARSAHAVAEAEHTLAQASQGRISQLRGRNAATAQELDEADARLSASAARLAAAQANVAQAAAQLAATRAAAEVADITESYAVVRAPFDGEITERLIDPGNLATPGLPLLRIDANGRRRVDARVDEARAGFVRPGDLVTVVLEAGPEPGGVTTLQGTVMEVARTVAVDQRAFTIKVALPAGVSPRTGTFARVQFDGARRRTVVVPASAVRTYGQLTSVFVAAEGRAHNRLVQVGNTGREGTEIIAGLDAGESVVATPPADLMDGRSVRVVTTPAGSSP